MSGEQRRRRHLDTVVHLDDGNVLFEVNVQTGDDPHIQVMLTDTQGGAHNVRYTVEQAWVVSDIVQTFDRRAVVEFAQLLAEGVHLITAEDLQQ